jgi:Ras-related protein Rap-1B
MKTGHGFLLVFSITSLNSLQELHTLREQIKRIKESSQVPIVLVGNKSDLEDDRAVTRSKAFQVSQSWGRVPYYETSAKRRANVDEVFRDLCRQIIRKDMENAVARGGASTAYRDHGMGGGLESGSSGSRSKGHSGHGRSKGKGKRKDKKDSGSSCTIL